MLGLSVAWSGVIQDSASTATLVALISGRERTSNYALMNKGMQNSDAPLIVYTSSEAHSGVNKAALLAGFGHNNTRLVPTDEHNAMSPLALKDHSTGFGEGKPALYRCCYDRYYRCDSDGSP